MLAHGNWPIVSCVTLLGNDFREENFILFLILLLIQMKVRPNVEVAYVGIIISEGLFNVLAPTGTLVLTCYFRNI